MRSEPKTWQEYMRLMRAALRAMPKVQCVQVYESTFGGIKCRGYIWPKAA